MSNSTSCPVWRLTILNQDLDVPAYEPDTYPTYSMASSVELTDSSLSSLNHSRYSCMASEEVTDDTSNLSGFSLVASEDFFVAETGSPYKANASFMKETKEAKAHIVKSSRTKVSKFE